MTFCFRFPSEQRSILNERISPMRSQFFPYKVDPFLEGRQKPILKIVSPEGISISLNYFSPSDTGLDISIVIYQFSSSLITIRITLSALRAKLTDDKLIFLSFFFQKVGLDISSKLAPWKTVPKKYQALLFRKMKQTI